MNIQKSVMWMKDLKEYCNDAFRPVDKETADYIIAALEELDERRQMDASKSESVRHGEWFGTVCSACGESVSFNFDCDYCPKCGAKMDLSD